MECDRLKRLIKNWYGQVQDETMAPARMVAFMRQHVADCTTCLRDPFVRPEIEKITNIILPPEKLRVTADDEPEEGDVAEHDDVETEDIVDSVDEEEEEEEEEDEY